MWLARGGYHGTPVRPALLSLPGKLYPCCCGSASLQQHARSAQPYLTSLLSPACPDEGGWLWGWGEGGRALKTIRKASHRVCQVAPQMGSLLLVLLCKHTSYIPACSFMLPCECTAAHSSRLNIYRLIVASNGDPPTSMTNHPFHVILLHVC